MTHLFVIPSITNYFTFLEDIAHELTMGGHKVVLATSTKHISQIECYNRDIHGELREIEFPRGFEWSQHIKAASELNNIVQDVKPDIVNVHFSAAIFTAAIAKKKNWPKTIGTFHGISFPMENGWRKVALGWAEVWAAKRLDKIFVLTPDDKEALLKKSGKINVDVILSYGLGCDLDRFNQEAISNSRKAELRKELGIRDDHFVFIFVGRQVHFKGFDKLIRAFIKLYSRNIKLRLILVGDKDNIHSSNLNRTEEKILRNCPGVLKVGWQENVHEYLSIADVNVFPSVREGMPVNLMESLAMGVPVITLDTRGCRNVVSHGEDGVLISEEAIDELAGEMIRMYDEREELNRMAMNAIKTRGKFDRKFFIKEQFEIFEKLLNEQI